jgi:hypothetical protein
MAGSLFAIAIRDTQGLQLVARAALRPSGIYFLMPRDAEDFTVLADEKWNPHASYHADGTLHVKSFNDVMLPPVKRQPLDHAFSGAEPLFAQAFQPGELAGLQVLTDVAPFREVFEIPRALIVETEHHTLAVDLLAPTAARPVGPWRDVVIEHSFADSVPWIHATLWRGLANCRTI